MSRSSMRESSLRGRESSRRERESSRRGSDRAQTEPTVALAAVFAVAVGVGLYAGVLSDAVPDRDRDLAEPTLGQVHERVTTGGVASPSRLDRLVDSDVSPAGYDTNVTLGAGGEYWAVGPPVGRGGSGAAETDTAFRRVAVRLAPGTVRPGRLTVRVRS